MSFLTNCEIHEVHGFDWFGGDHSQVLLLKDHGVVWGFSRGVRLDTSFGLDRKHSFFEPEMRDWEIKINNLGYWCWILVMYDGNSYLSLLGPRSYDICSTLLIFDEAELCDPQCFPLNGWLHCRALEQGEFMKESIRWWDYVNLTHWVSNIEYLSKKDLIIHFPSLVVSPNHTSELNFRRKFAIHKSIVSFDLAWIFF